MEGNELNNYLSRGNSRLNYGLYAGMYWQDKVTTVITPKTDENGNTINENVSLISYESSSLDYYTLDAFFEFYFKNDFNIKAEVAYIVGTNENDDSFNQWGIAFQSNVNFLMNTLVAGVDFGIASADTSSDSDPYKTIGQKIDYKKDNFTFNPDYDIDLIFFKEINFISNLYYIRPHISWLATENISLNLWSVTSIAFNEEQTYGRDTYLGTELDTSIEYLNKDGLNFGIRGGIFIPGAGMDWLGTDGERGGAVTELKDSIADLAFTIQAFLVMKF
jgi:hypothetical protein